MHRIASHFIGYRKAYKMHYVELDDNGRFVAIRPLTEEIAGTEFYNGIILLIPDNQPVKTLKEGLSRYPRLLDNPREELERFTQENAFLWENEEDRPLALYHLQRLHPTSELGTDNGGSNCHIQRL